MTLNLIAPAAYTNFQAKSGTRYSSDAYSVVNDVANGDVLDLINMGCILTGQSGARNNLTATTAPTATDDSSKEYGVGSRWTDTTNKSEYLCIDATADAAVWILIASANVVNVTAANLAITAEKHAGKIVTLNKADGQAVTLPAATGSGKTYEFVIGTTISSSSTTIKAANASDSMLGGVVAQDTDSAGTGKFWAVAASDDTITLDGTATGGKAGDRIRITDVAANMWNVEGFLKQSGGSEATPFSATVS